MYNIAITVILIATALSSFLLMFLMCKMNVPLNVVILNVLAFATLLYSFNLNTIMIFTVVNIYSIQNMIIVQ